jgi:hypothetical protein
MSEHLINVRYRLSQSNGILSQAVRDVRFQLNRCCKKAAEAEVAR